MTTFFAKQKETERQHRIDHILEAAKTVFMEKGYKNATLRKIALKAQITTGAIYVYFSGKDELYAEVCKQIFHLMNSYLDKASKVDGDIKQRIMSMAMAILRFEKDHHDAADMLAANFSILNLPDKLSEELSELGSQTTYYITRIIIDGKKEGFFPPDKDDVRLALSLWSSLEGFLYMNDYGIFDKYDIDFEELVKDHINYFICGIQQYKEEENA
ncbi:MAG: TetR/AcrR family transcriptional regulator [Desulfobacterales bacterium]|nr:TetR/AcrR family transcriptional regulator [Desulfobacterales bacterium]